MTDCDHILGVSGDYDGAKFLRLSALEWTLKTLREHRAHAATPAGKRMQAGYQDALLRCHTDRDLLAMECNGDFNTSGLFNFCPLCGEPVDGRWVDQTGFSEINDQET